ncbi:hypothetical protein [Paracidovorax konjaci]|uniref:Uncharacterized protein n=1 Tax=Paracidovorax konjaci TaxID=32040 RepID=A0A1I1TDI2_9BURK|nr:hypothetical protein [Paracidovorax konjaci]SFD56636.1 hypothetical protein SAMN04489710_103294 [Paracidovorax konjaci]
MGIQHAAFRTGWDRMSSASRPSACYDRDKQCQSAARKYSKMDWVPIVFIVFKVLVFGTGMFFAIKWHYDQDKKKKKEAAEQ